VGHVLEEKREKAEKIEFLGREVQYGGRGAGGRRVRHLAQHAGGADEGAAAVAQAVRLRDAHM